MPQLTILNFVNYNWKTMVTCHALITSHVLHVTIFYQLYLLESIGLIAKEASIWCAWRGKKYGFGYLTVSIGWNLTLTNWKLLTRIIFSTHQPIRCLGFQTYFTKYLRETLRHIFRLCSSSIWVLKVYAYCSVKVNTSDHSHTHWSGGFKLLPSNYQVYWIQILNGTLKCKDWRFTLQKFTIRDICGT